MYPENLEGSAHESFTGRLVFRAGKKTTAKLNLDNYRVDGKFTGIGGATFGVRSGTLRSLTVFTTGTR